MILTDLEGPIGTITLNRPQALNTLTHEFILKLTEAIRAMSIRTEVRVIILTGSGERAFVGGVDVRAMMDLDPQGAEKFITDLHRSFLAIRQSEKIVIASVNGSCLRPAHRFRARPLWHA